MKGGMEFKVASAPGVNRVRLSFRWKRFTWFVIRITLTREDARRVAGALDRAAVHGA